MSIRSRVILVVDFKYHVTTAVCQGPTIGVELFYARNVSRWLMKGQRIYPGASPYLKYCQKEKVNLDSSTQPRNAAGESSYGIANLTDQNIQPTRSSLEIPLILPWKRIFTTKHLTQYRADHVWTCLLPWLIWTKLCSLSLQITHFNSTFQVRIQDLGLGGGLKSSAEGTSHCCVVCAYPPKIMFET